MGSRAAAPLGVGTLVGGTALPLPLYIVEAKGLANTRSSSPVGAALPLSLLVSRSAWRSPAGNHAAPPPPRRHADAGVLFPNLSLLLAGSRRRRRHQAARVLNTEAPLFGA